MEAPNIEKLKSEIDKLSWHAQEGRFSSFLLGLFCGGIITVSFAILLLSLFDWYAYVDSVLRIIFISWLVLFLALFLIKMRKKRSPAK